MRNLFEENPKLALGLVVTSAVLAMGANYMVKRHNAKQMEMVAELEEGGRNPAADTPRLKEIRQLEYRDPDQALSLVEAVIAAPESEGELDAAKEKHANILQLCFNNRLKAGQLEEAKEFMERLGRTYPESYLVANTSRRWADQRKKTCSEYVRAGQFAEAKSVLWELTRNDWYYGDARVLGEYQEKLIERWTAAGAGEGVEFDKLLEAASVISSLNHNTPVVRALHDCSLSGPRLLELGDHQPVGSDRFRAIPFYQAALRRLSSGRKPWHSSGPQPSYEAKQALGWNTEAKLAGLFGSLAGLLDSGQRTLLTAQDSDSVCREGAGQLQNAPLRGPLWQQLISRQQERLRTLAKTALAYSLEELSSRKLRGEEYNRLNTALREAGSLGGDILHRSGAFLWASRVMDTNFNPWPLLGPTVQKEFAVRRENGEREDNLRQSLASRGQSQEFQNPLDELKETRQTLSEINARRGLFEHLHQPESCVMWLRRALTENRDPALVQSINHAVVLAMLHCRKQSKFLSFYELTGFFVSDLGLETLSPSLRNEFHAALDEGAQQLAKEDRSKAIFLQAIQVEAYADENRKPELKAQTIKKAFEIVSRVRTTQIAPDRLVSSGLDELSLLSVDNSTEHHLLIFYRGPESFFIAVRPFRKSSALMKDGQYDIAVIAPSGAIQPYRGQVNLHTAWQKSIYRLEASNTDQNRFVAWQGSGAHGEYSLARQPENSGRFKIDPRTGAVHRE